ncbi:serine/threonine-protein kinase [Actinoallomurus rhizosphaericola]|uniref:serine/threonine-protein kinase n=1 Tax=Actinoallomurus rhizosphaericola TaxID=2952536 RepID=UPI0020939FA3|nr:serine/threonine-protein kinase [Actinoallomurus rhizosphaericola]MCO5997776.1 serine/threonine protein kinase [Actinoallomurus rhizosphaericola]
MPEKPLLAQRYRLLTEVGRGGMGTVWHARDEALGRDVAVKEVILPHGFSDEEREIQHKRTFREARTAARLSHPGVVTVFDVVEEDGRPWIVMELIRARSLEQMIKQDGPLSPRRAAEIGRQMLSALMTAHEAGILHRDVKPSNVLVIDGRSIRAVLTDFGIARAQSDATLTQTGMLIGSPAYIAPERAKGRQAVPASDLWSLGATLYAAVEGKSPFERTEAMASLVAVLTEEPPPAPHAGPLAPVIAGLLRKDQETRLTAAEAGVMLDRILMDTSGSTRVMETAGAQAASTRTDSGDPAAMPITGQVMTPADPGETATDDPAARDTPVDHAGYDAAVAEDGRPVWLSGRHGNLAIAVVLAVIVIGLIILTLVR